MIANDCNAMLATCTILSIWNNTLLLRIYIHFFLMLESIFWRVHYRNLYELHINL